MGGSGSLQKRRTELYNQDILKYLLQEVYRKVYKDQYYNQIYLTIYLKKYIKKYIDKGYIRTLIYYISIVQLVIFNTQFKSEYIFKSSFYLSILNLSNQVFIPDTPYFSSYLLVTLDYQVILLINIISTATVYSHRLVPPLDKSLIGRLQGILYLK